MCLIAHKTSVSVPNNPATSVQTINVFPVYLLVSGIPKINSVKSALMDSHSISIPVAVSALPLTPILILITYVSAATFLISGIPKLVNAKSALKTLTWTTTRANVLLVHQDSSTIQ